MERFPPGIRLEEFMYNKLDKQKPPRSTNSEKLGQIMVDAGQDYGPGTTYGKQHNCCHSQHSESIPNAEN